jgi:hypothetical protein
MKNDAKIVSIVRTDTWTPIMQRLGPRVARTIRINADM